MTIIPTDSRRAPRWADYPGPAEAAGDFEYRPLRIDASMSRSAAATMLSLRAEFAGWELARLLRFQDGSRQVWLRRKKSAAILPDLTP